MAREAFGRAVIADEPTRSPISDHNGRVVYWQQIRTLTLDDGSTAYGCAHCEYASRNVRSIRPHLGKHNRRRSARGQVPGDMSLNTLVEQLSTLTQVQADLDRWKARALKAEKSLRTLRNTLGITP